MNRAATPMRYAFIFVCQKGEIEVQAMLLAASLVRHLRCDYELIAVTPVPESWWGAPSPDTLRFLRELGVHLVPIANRVHSRYPIGNKIACVDVGTRADKVVVLDSDVLMLREFYDEPRFRIDFNAKPADRATFSTSIPLWRRVYACMGLAVPRDRMMATESGELMPPYFNSGVIAVARDASLGEAWVDCCRAIDQAPGIPRKRPWLDQIALPVAVAVCGLSVDLLGRDFNYPAHLRRLEHPHLPMLCHYHSPRVLVRQRAALRAVDGLCRAHPALARSMSKHAGFSEVLRRAMSIGS